MTTLESRHIATPERLRCKVPNAALAAITSSIGMASHDASLSLPAVKNATPRAKAIVSNFERIAVTNPVWGVGLPATHAP
jgi:hypothetical protein